MIFKKHSKKWLVIVFVILALLPIAITAYEVIFAESESIIFLGSYNPKIAILVIAYYILLLGAGVFWFIKKLIFITKLKNEKVKSELMLLKSQVSPHFFFNMLNNLYGLVAKDSRKAQDMILKLSDMMRYSIYEGDKDLVTIKEEVNFLKNYIELHRMRYHKFIDISFDCNIEENYEVTPLLFIILLENAFKHGVENLTENAFIKASITSACNRIQFTVINNFDSSGSEGNKNGMGLKNLKRRLELVYPNRHEMSFSTTGNVYKAQLILEQL